MGASEAFELVSPQSAAFTHCQLPDLLIFPHSFNPSGTLSSWQIMTISNVENLSIKIVNPRFPTIINLILGICRVEGVRTPGGEFGKVKHRGVLAVGTLTHNLQFANHPMSKDFKLDCSNFEDIAHLVLFSDFESPVLRIELEVVQSK